MKTNSLVTEGPGKILRALARSPSGEECKKAKKLSLYPSEGERGPFNCIVTVQSKHKSTQPVKIQPLTG